MSNDTFDRDARLIHLLRTSPRARAILVQWTIDRLVADDLRQMEIDETLRMVDQTLAEIRSSRGI